MSDKLRVLVAYMEAHVLVVALGVLAVRLVWPSPALGLSHLDACLIAVVWHLPLTAFVYRFAGADLLPGGAARRSRTDG